jgi:hypothetical protein
MLRKLVIGLSLVLMSVLSAAPVVTAQDQVSGTMDLTWNSCWEAPSEAVPDWIGTIDMDGDVYDMLFFNVGSGRPPDTALAEHLVPFNEMWAIYRDLEVSVDADCALQKLEGDLVLWGHDHGISDLDDWDRGGGLR